MNTDRRDPFINARFRVEIDGLPHTGATEVIFPEARIITGPRQTRMVQFGGLVLRRGMTRSPDWYDWWDRARTSAKADRRNVSVILMDASRADVTRWLFSGAVPSAYGVSPLSALGNQPLIETLELSIAGLKVAFGDDATPETDARSPTRGKGSTKRTQRNYRGTTY
jgi:phage tail-like protein